MSVILFKLRNVPDDEAEEIRELLSANNIEYYETPPGRWGISMEAIWLKDEALLDNAKQLIEEYQVNRSEKARQDYKKLEQDGKVETFIQRLLNRPVHTLLTFATILVILYFILMPFVKLTYK